jgi:hypothetical protein
MLRKADQNMNANHITFVLTLWTESFLEYGVHNGASRMESGLEKQASFVSGYTRVLI